MLPNEYAAIVFLGPTLPLTEARQVLPEAFYLPPVSCGDVLRVLRLKPKNIVIIDGFFENTAAVWHKEILFALEKGVRVFGSSSMGALRAAELARYGMLGRGEVFTAYYQQTIIDDDEVAILHGPKQSNYLAMTDAMVNVRATLASAVEKKAIRQETAEFLCRIAKGLVYRERTFSKVLELAHAEEYFQNRNVMGTDLVNFQQHLDSGGYIDQKREDAVGMLKHIALLQRENCPAEQSEEKASQTDMPTKNRFSQCGKPKCEEHIGEKIHHSVFLRVLKKSIYCRPFHCDQEQLPSNEKVARYARYLGSGYIITRRLAYILAAGYALSLQKSYKLSSELKIEMPVLPSDFCGSYDCRAEDQIAFQERICQIQTLIDCEEKHLSALPNIASVQDYFLGFMRLINDYKKHRESIGLQNADPKNAVYESYWKNEPSKARAIFYTAKLWRILENQKEVINLLPQLHNIQEYSDKFRSRLGLARQKDTEEWLEKNDLDLPGYQGMICSAAKFSFLVLQNNLDILHISHHVDDVWWLRDALWLSGLYQDGKDLMLYPEKLKMLQERALKEEADLNEYAYSQDFLGGANEFLAPR